MKRLVFACTCLLAAGFLWAAGGKEQGQPQGAATPAAPKAEAPRTTPEAAGNTPAPKTPPPSATGAAAPAEIAPRIGLLAYLDGEVGLTRNGRRLVEDRVAIGMDVENFDTIATAKDGTAEVEITSPVSPGTVLRIDPNTTFVLEVTRVGESATAADFTVLRGALAFKVTKITGGHEVTVRTDNAVLGVRGTEFRVVTSPTGDTLVSCREGAVEVRDGAGSTQARPGEVVEKLGDQPFRSIAVTPETIDGFERAWYAERIEALRANALRASQAYAERYERSLGRFRAAFLSLVDDHADLIQKWVREDREGRVGSTVEQMNEKKQVVGAIFRAQRELVVLERLYHRLTELQGYHEQGTGRGNIRPGLTTQEFYTRFLAEGGELVQDLNYLRYTMKLYARRNGGTFPSAPASMDDDFDDDDFDEEEGDEEE